MVRILLNGCNGVMGRNISACVETKNDCEIVCGVDVNDNVDNGFPVYKSIFDVKEKIDVIIDFSHPNALKDVLKFGSDNGIPCVIATTGMSKEHIEMINSAAEVIPVFFTFNMSLGINVIASLAKKAAAVLADDFDIEIVEAHHNRKLDAPSGTAIMLADAVCDAGNGHNYHFEYDRHSKRAKRDKNEIGIHSIRGGTITGEHEIIFAGNDEIIKLSHSARSKKVFAVGSVNAAKFIVAQGRGIYNMDDLLR